MPQPALILGIESSCDETSCAVVADGRDVLSNVVASQIELHTRYGGVVPELASRAHIEAVNTVIQQAIADARAGSRDLSAVAVTNEPGLIGSLLVGLMAAKTLAWVWDRPLIGVNHVYAHAYAAALNAQPIEYPAAALICSGGHTALYRCEGPTKLDLMGATLDDAAGEAFDKVASILNLGYPGGPIIDRLAATGNPQAVRLPRSLLKGQSLDFSFSGIKTAVLYHVNGVPAANRKSRIANRECNADGGNGQPATGQSAIRNPQSAIGNPPRKTGIANFSPREIADIAAGFQAAVVDVLTIKLRRLARLTGARTLILGGGVAANTGLRTAMTGLAGKLRCTLRLPELRFCMDNAAMTAGLAWHYLQAGKIDGLNLDAHATVKR